MFTFYLETVVCSGQLCKITVHILKMAYILIISYCSSFSVGLMDLARELANTNSGIYRLWIPPFGAVNIYNANDVEVRSVLTFICLQIYVGMYPVRV